MLDTVNKTTLSIDGIIEASYKLKNNYIHPDSVWIPENMRFDFYNSLENYFTHFDDPSGKPNMFYGMPLYFYNNIEEIEAYISNNVDNFGIPPQVIVVT